MFSELFAYFFHAPSFSYPMKKSRTYFLLPALYFLRHFSRYKFENALKAVGRHADVGGHSALLLLTNQVSPSAFGMLQ